MRALFQTEDGHIFINSEDEKFLITENGFMPTEIETEGLEPKSFDMDIQVLIDNIQLKLNLIKAEIAEAIANFE